MIAEIYNKLNGNILGINNKIIGINDKIRYNRMVTVINNQAVIGGN